jgi:chaperonin GroES
MSVKFTPKQGRIMVKPDLPPAEVGGILIPEQSKEKPASGVIVALCESLSGYEIGSKILFARGAGFPFQLEGTEYFLVKETDVLGDYGI